jgi:hypothetical protein
LAEVHTERNIAENKSVLCPLVAATIDTWLSQTILSARDPLSDLGDHQASPEFLQLTLIENCLFRDGFCSLVSHSVMEEELQLERDVLAARNDDFQMSMDEAFVMSGQLDQLLEQPSSEVKSSPENSQAFERSAAIVAHHELAPEAELSNDSAKVVAKLEVSTKFDDLESWVSPDERDFRRSLHTLHDQSHLLKTTILPALEAVRVAQSDNKNADEVKRTHEVLQQTNRELYHTQCNLMAKTIADGKRMLMSMEAAHAAMVQFDVLQPWQPPAYALGDQYMDIDLSMFETSMDTCVSAGDAKTSASAGAGSAGTSLMSMMQRQLPSPLRASVEQILPPVSSVIPQRQLQLPIIVCYAKMYYDPFFVVIYEVSRYPNEKVIASQLKVLEKHQHLAQQDPQVRELCCECMHVCVRECGVRRHALSEFERRLFVFFALEGAASSNNQQASQGGTHARGGIQGLCMGDAAGEFATIG